MNKDTMEARILIADDIPRNIQLLGSLLTKEGYEIAAVTKGKQVQPSVEKFDPDLILLDVMMPDKNGFEVCKELKAAPAHDDIPIIFLTGKAEQEDVIKGLELGGSDYITKPFNTQELLIRVKTHVALKQSQDQIRRQNEQLEQANVTKDKLYSVIGHDLKSPINAITGFSKMLFDDFKDEENFAKARKKLDIINQSAHKVSRLLDDLLSWARVQTGDLQFLIEKFSIADVVENVINLLSISAEKKGVELSFSPKNDKQVEGDERIITTIVRNLVSNAIKYSNEGDRVTITLGAEKNTWSLAVQDEGMGITDELKEGLFNGQTNKSVKGTAGEKGTGLGLILCKELAEMHGGTIEIESREGEGSTFTLRIPEKVNAENVI